MAVRLKVHDTLLASWFSLLPWNARPNEVVAETRCLGHQVNSLDVVPAGSWALRDAGGSRTHLDRVAAGCLAVWLQRRSVSVLARNRTWSTTSAKSCAVRHTPRTSWCSIARLGIEPHLADPKSAVPSITLAGRTTSSPSRNRTWSDSFGSCHAIRHNHGPCCQRPDLESNQDRNLRRILCAPLHHRDVNLQGRRLDSHQHEPVYRTGAFLSRATSA